MMKDMGDPKVLKEVVEASEKINKSHEESKNKIVIKEFNKPQALWKDSNTFILTLRLKGEFDGEEIIEVQTISVTYYKGYLIYYYINELEENSIPGHNIKLLTDVAKK